MNKLDLDSFYHAQLNTFPLAGKNVRALEKVIYKTIQFPHFQIQVQHNPDRMISTAARIDEASLKARPCFLCIDKIPAEQQGSLWQQSYYIFVNPYPIFPEHFTVPATQHIPQQIEGHFEDLLALALDFPQYTVFYNGPQCGASAPDHFHFQMAPRHRMPLETDVENEMLQQNIMNSDYYKLYTLKDYLRKLLVIQASDAKLLCRIFHAVNRLLATYLPADPEPRYNLLAWFDNCQWTLCLFPRTERRPREFYASGEEQILFSPGCVDIAGLIIAPRLQDFEKYSSSLLSHLFAQVTVEDSLWETFLEKLIHLQL